MESDTFSSYSVTIHFTDNLLRFVAIQRLAIDCYNFIGNFIYRNVDDMLLAFRLCLFRLFVVWYFVFWLQLFVIWSFVTGLFAVFFVFIARAVCYRL
jgi:hypothetical protein